MKSKMRVILIAPAIAFFVVFTLWPLFEIVWLSFYKTNFIKTTFVGLDNYIQAFTDENFRASILNSLLYSALLVPTQVFFGFIGALLVYQVSKKWQDISRILFYVPILSSGIIIAQVWKWGFSTGGAINWLLSFVGVEPISWFAQGSTGIPAVAFIVLLSSFGGNVLLIFTSLLDLDKGILEAGKIDGASYVQRVFYIIIPAVMPTLKMVALLTVVASFQIYETILMLCPYEYTGTMTFHIYATGFRNSNYGLASVEGLLLMVIVMVLISVKNGLNREKN